MTIKVTHGFHSTKGDGGDSSVVRPSDWNADHVVATDSSTGMVVGKQAGAAGAVEELPLVYDGTTWEMQSTGALLVPKGTTAQRPGTPKIGDMRWNTTTNNVEFYGVNGVAAWTALSPFLPGQLCAFACVAGTGWLYCDGTAVSRTTYSALFLALGSGVTWGAGNGTTTFNVPNLVDRVPVGVGATYALGAVRGAWAYNVPLKNHAHSFLTDQGTTPGFPQPVNYGIGGTGGGNVLQQITPDNANFIGTDVRGDGAAPQISVEQPGVGVYWYVKT